MTDRDFAALLERSALLSDLDPLSRTALGMHMRAGRYAPGEKLITHGEPATRILLLLQGEVDVQVSAEDGAPRDLARLGPDHFLGEVAFFGHREAASADVVSVHESIAAEIDRTTYDGMVQSDPGAAETLEKIVLGVLLDRVGETNDRLVALVHDRADDPTFKAAARMLARKL